MMSNLHDYTFYRLVHETWLKTVRLAPQRKFSKLEYGHKDWQVETDRLLKEYQEGAVSYFLATKPTQLQGLTYADVRMLIEIANADSFSHFFPIRISYLNGPVFRTVDFSKLHNIRLLPPLIVDYIRKEYVSRKQMGASFMDVNRALYESLELHSYHLLEGKFARRTLDQSNIMGHLTHTRRMKPELTNKVMEYLGYAKCHNLAARLPYRIKCKEDLRLRLKEMEDNPPDTLASMAVHLRQLADSCGLVTKTEPIVRKRKVRDDDEEESDDEEAIIDLTDTKPKKKPTKRKKARTRR